MRRLPTPMAPTPIVVAGLVACCVVTAVAQAPPPAATPQAKKTRLVPRKLGSIARLHAFDDIYLASQPSRDDLRLMRAQGVKTVLTLRPASELRWDEAAAVRELGMKFVSVPFQSPKQLTPKVFDRVLEALRDKNRGLTMFHCASANRVGAIWYAYRMLDDNISPDVAMKEAQRVGLRTPAYLQLAQAYVQQARKASGK